MSNAREVLAAPGRAAPAASHLHLTAQETGHLTGLLEELSGTVDNPTAEGFLADVPRLAWRLPRRLVDTLLDFRRHESSSALVLHGLPVDDRVIGPTPLNWRAVPSPSATLRQELYLMLVAGLLGEVFGWSTLQDGRLIHDIVPMPTEENEQSGHGTVLLEWHTEDGFHPYRCDYLLLLGLRNHDKVPTTVAAVDAVDLSGQLRDILFQRRFLIRPDNEHLKRAADLVGGIQRRHLIQEMQDAPEPCAVLFGHPERPYVRVDPTFMDAAPGDTEAREALDALVHQLEAGLENVALGPGELLIVDNYKAVHGRSAFTARFDGTDRWLKKAVVTRDLRKSRTLRAAPGERILL